MKGHIEVLAYKTIMLLGNANKSLFETNTFMPDIQ